MTDDGQQNSDLTDGFPYDDAADAARFDEQPMPDVTAALADLDFLRPDRDPGIEAGPMPEWAWDRLSSALAAEAAARAADTHQNVIAFPTIPAPAPTVAERPSRGMRWAGGLVAASVAVVALAVVVPMLRTGGSDSAVVAGDAPVVLTASATALAKNAAPAPSAAAAAEQAPSAFSAATPDPELLTSADAGVTPAPAPVTSGPSVRSGGAATITPAKMVMATGTNYLPEALPTQVVDLLDSVGVDNPDQAAALPVQTPEAWPVGTGGFTASMSSLRDCIKSLTQSPDVQALIVDHSTYQGNDAGVVVAPAVYRRDPGTPSPTASVDTDMGRLDVWVVNPDCSTVDRKVLQYLLDQWRG